MPVECWLASELVFSAPDGPLTLTELQVRWEEGVFLRFQVDGPTWRRIDEQELFDLARDRRGPHFAGGFGDGAPVEIEARLLEEHVPVVTSQSEDVFDAAAHVLATEALHRPGAWRGLLAVQERVPGLKAGFRME